MADESAYQFLRRRQTQLIAQASALNGQLRPIEAELAQIERMLSVAQPSVEAQVDVALSRTWNSPLALDYSSALKSLELPEIAGKLRALGELPAEVAEKLRALGEIPAEVAATFKGLGNLVVSADVVSNQKYESMTIKELAIQALIDHFPNGATMMEIRDFIQDGYGRRIFPSSLRPQMHRLKEAGVLGQDPSTDTWNFQDGKRHLYAKYDHPTSRQAMNELKDDEIPATEPRTRLGEMEPPVKRRKVKDDFLE